MFLLILAWRSHTWISRLTREDESLAEHSVSSYAFPLGMSFTLPTLMLQYILFMFNYLLFSYANGDPDTWSFGMQNRFWTWGGSSLLKCRGSVWIINSSLCMLHICLPECLPSVCACNRSTMVLKRCVWPESLQVWLLFSLLLGWSCCAQANGCYLVILLLARVMAAGSLVHFIRWNSQWVCCVVLQGKLGEGRLSLA